MEYMDYEPNADFFNDQLIIDYEDEPEYDGHINDKTDKMREDKYMSLDEAIEFEESYVIGQAENN